MYSGYLLSNKSKQYLFDLFPPMYPNIYAHHITEEFGIKGNASAPTPPNDIKVVGYMNNGYSIEGLLVEIDGKVSRPNGGDYHITWSIDKKVAKPVDTNKLTSTARMLNTPIAISVIPKIFK